MIAKAQHPNKSSGIIRQYYVNVHQVATAPRSTSGAMDNSNSSFGYSSSIAMNTEGFTDGTSMLAFGNATTFDPLAEHYLEEDMFFQFVTSGVFITVIGIMGLTGNSLSIVVLSRPQMRSSINCCLIGLASFDILVLLTAILMFGLTALCHYLTTCNAYTTSVHPYIVPVVYPLGMIAQTGSVWVTVIVTIERYVAVCLPLRARSLCTYGRARIYIFVIAVFSIMYNIPRFFEVERLEDFDPKRNRTIMIAQASLLRSDPDYIKIYINGMYLVVMYFVPFILLAVLNSIIWMKVRQANRERQNLSRLQQKEMSLAIMLFCVVVVFFICNILALVINILEVACGYMDEDLTASSNLLVTINSSVNFVIYCIFGQKFRRILVRTMCMCCPDQLRRGRFARGELEESCVYPVSSANTAETRPLMHYNGNGHGISVRISASATTDIDSISKKNGSTSSMNRSNSGLESIGIGGTPTSASPAGSIKLNHSCRRSFSRRIISNKLEMPD